MTQTEPPSPTQDHGKQALFKTYLARWDLANPVPLAHTPTSTVYRVRRSDGAVAVLKCLTETGVRDEAPGGNILTWYDGIGAVRLLRKDRNVHLLESADGGSLRQHVLQGRDDEAIDIICGIVRDLHRPRSSAVPASLIPLRTRFRALFNAAQADAATGIVQEAAELAEALLETQTAIVPLHGDLHHDNVRCSSERGAWLAIDPKGLLGDPAYDVASVFLNPTGVPDVIHRDGRLRRLADRFADTLDVAPQRILQFAFVHAVLSALWSREGGDNPAPTLSIAQSLHQELDGVGGPRRDIGVPSYGGRS